MDAEKNNWMMYQKKLVGQTVDLVSMDEKHFPELMQLASDKRIWQHYVYDGSDPQVFQRVLELALVERDKGSQFPFVILNKADSRLIGSTRFLDIQPKHRKLEIGTTWLHPDFWGTEINLECKLLLLTFCFETLQTLRVQLKTDENNVRSRKAIEKIGGHFEGILRNDMLRDNNTRRNSACYSIIDEEWKEKKSALTMLLKTKRNTAKF